MGHFPRLTAAALDLTPVTPDFTQTITDTLGSLGTSADGFDAYLAATLAGLSSGGDLGSSLDGDLGLAAGILSLINPNSLASDMASLPASLAEGDVVVASANALLVSTGVTTPAPTPTPPPKTNPSPAPPASGGSSGSGGGGASGQGATGPLPVQTGLGAGDIGGTSGAGNPGDTRVITKFLPA